LVVLYLALGPTTQRGGTGSGGERMNERLAELLAKGQADRLTPAERQELAHLLNAPVLDPLENPPTGFISKHGFVPSDVASRLRAINWFSRCGEPLSLDLSMEIEQVRSWREAIESCKDGVWENVQLEAQNQLTVWLHQHDRQKYQEWNKLVDKHKAAVVKKLTEEKWVPYQRRHGLEMAFVHSVQWDVLGALMENTYLGSGHQCFFFLELLSVYEAGHFPCGWRGEWPRGKLIVY
jgi:hypothetical protein